MNIQTDREFMVFRQDDSNGRAHYKLGISKKKQDGTYENGYIPVSFRKDIVVENRTKIKLKNAWVDFYNKKVTNNGNEYKQTMPYIFINEFEKTDQVQQTSVVNTVSQACDEFAEEIVINDDDLPFD